ncbi:GNAT family N-acetyltransferase [Natronoglomus mannanivorans]|uniref:GNAT family N-acetyltransferase n=1 Tax=Natronoglomus mannanivorans TaxID=2979990 RepID=A0AAP3E081_9EURY|nr:GNAT family N-acetyltransferase [Halobacteria archaeon AArc-xg1-1]
MNLREATEDDLETVRSIAHSSLSSSYSHFLDEETIDDAVEQWYGESLADDMANEDFLVLVAEEDGEVVAFSQSEFVGDGHNTGQILWIHVDPDARGSGTGVRLLARTREELLESGAEHIRATVLEDNETGNEFYDSHGFERSGTIEVDIGEETYTENVFVESESDDDDSDGDGDDSWRALEEVTVDDESVFVSYGEVARGSDAPFYTAYEHENSTSRYGWFCGNCDSLDNAMDSMGRIQCNSCGNHRKATRWDASYL